MKQPRKTLGEVRGIVTQVRCHPYDFEVIEKEEGVWLLQLSYLEADVEVWSDRAVLQKTRKWYISPFSTTTEIIETCYAACLRSAKHRIREAFMYRGAQVMSPHIHIDSRVEMVKQELLDRRIPLEEEEE